MQLQRVFRRLAYAPVGLILDRLLFDSHSTGGNMNVRIVLVAAFVLVLSLACFYSGVESKVAGVNAFSALLAPTPEAAPSGNALGVYRGITIGTAITDTRAKLGEPKEKSDQGDYFIIGNGETTQTVYEAGKVKVISTSYFGDKVKAPTVKEILGTDVVPNAEGAINKMIKFPKAGFWISYVRTAGSDPMVMVTIQKMSKDES